MKDKVKRRESAGEAYL